MKKNPLENMIDEIIWVKRNAEVIIEDRRSKEGVRIISGEEINNAGTEFIFLKDGTMIPYHRIIEIRIEGKTSYKRKSENGYGW